MHSPSTLVLANMLLRVNGRWALLLLEADLCVPLLRCPDDEDMYCPAWLSILGDPDDRYLIGSDNAIGARPAGGARELRTGGRQTSSMEWDVLTVHVMTLRGTPATRGRWTLDSIGIAHRFVKS